MAIPTTSADWKKCFLEGDISNIIHIGQTKSQFTSFIGGVIFFLAHIKNSDADITKHIDVLTTTFPILIEFIIRRRTTR